MHVTDRDSGKSNAIGTCPSTRSTVRPIVSALFLPPALREAQAAVLRSVMGGDLEVFALQGRHAAPMGVKFGVRTVDRWGMGPKTENFTRFYHTSEYKFLARAYSLHELYDILGIVESFMQGLGRFAQSYGGLKLRVSGYRQIFNALWWRNCTSDPKTFLR